MSFRSWGSCGDLRCDPDLWGLCGATIHCYRATVRGAVILADPTKKPAINPRTTQTAANPVLRPPEAEAVSGLSMPGAAMGVYHGFVVSARGLHEARPGRQAVVAASLADLRGPVSGAVQLPLRLFWSLPDHEFDLDDRDMRLWLYQTVLREASRPGDLSAYLDSGLLAELWPQLYLPRGVRRAWEDQHPQLRTLAAA